MVKQKLKTVLKWLPHVMGFFWGVLLTFEFFEVLSMPDLMHSLEMATTAEVVIAIASLVALVSVVLAYKKRQLGAALMMLSFISIAIAEKKWMVGPVFPFIFLTGFLHWLLAVFYEKSNTHTISIKQQQNKFHQL